MTADLERLMNLRSVSVHKDANIQAAEDIGKKAELGYFDVEFTMYGCTYLERGADMMQYRISSQACDIVDFIEQAARADFYPSNLETMTFSCPVPVGAKELIAQDVKIELAKVLRQKYPKAFFQTLYQTADIIHSNEAAEMLGQEAEAISGRFEEEALSGLETLVHYAYSCKRLERAAYDALLRWIEEERRCMDDDQVSKDIFTKTLYGIVYQGDGWLKYFSNAQREHVYQKAYSLETQGILVSPLYAKTYWYNYEYRLPDVLKDYQAQLKRVYNQDFVGKLVTLKGQASAQQRQSFAQQLALVSERYGSGPADTMRRYGCRWGVL